MVDFLIIGTPKAGTTALQYYLSQHTDIFMPKEKEVHFFGEEFRNSEESEQQIYRRNYKIEDYEKLFEAASKKQIKGEASVFYLYSPTAVKEIKEYNPKMKIIVCFRNPIDFLTSYHQDQIYVGNEDEPDFWKALSLEEKRKYGESIPKSCTLRKALYYSEMVKYKHHLKAYIDEFGRENVYPIIFEEFITSPQSSYEKVLNFLNVKKELNYSIDFKKVNPRRNVRLKWFDNFIKQPSSNFRKFARVFIPSQKKRFLAFQLLRKINTSHSRVNELADHEKRKLYKVIESHIKELEEYLQINLSIWKKYN